MMQPAPRPYPDWRDDEHRRAEDAAHTFGFHLINHCRNEAFAALPANLNPEDRNRAEEAIHVALHNMMDLLEGYWRLESGLEHTVKYQLCVVVKDKNDKVVESVDITKGVDLPIGFWGWAKEGNFR